MLAGLLAVTQESWQAIKLERQQAGKLMCCSLGRFGMDC